MATATDTTIKTARADTNLAAALVVLALVVRSVADAPSRELDELLALSLASGPLSEAIAATPLWDALLWSWVQLLDVGSARLLSGALGAAQIGLIYLIARVLALPKDTAAAVAVLVLLTPLTLAHAQDIRPDALLGLMVTAAWGSGLAGWRQGWRGWGHGAAVIGAMLVHPLGAALVLPLAIRGPRRMWLVLAPLGLLVLLGIEAGPRVHPEVLLSLLRAFALDEPVSLAVVGVLLVGVFQHPGPHSSALLAWLLVPILAAMLLGADLRYVAACLPALWLLAGLGLAGLSTTRRWVILSPLLVVGVLSLSHHMTHPLPRGDIDALHAALPVLAADDVLAARSPPAWELVLSRPVESLPADPMRIERWSGRRVLWLIGEHPEAHQETIAALRAHTVVLQEVSAGGGQALLLSPGGRAADHSAAVFEPVGVRDGRDLLLYANAAVVLSDLTTDGPGRYAVDVLARGSDAGGVPAKLEITLEGARPEGNWVWSLPTETQAHRVTFAAERSGGVVLRFLNDGTLGSEDRNIWIEQVALSKLEDGDQQR